MTDVSKIDKTYAELKELKAQHANKVTKELREQIPAKKEELINLIKEL